jgi:hypothetical protein
MPVTVVTTFIKSDASTEDYVNPEVKKVLDQYVASNKITERSSWTSEDGLTQKRTRVYADQAAFDEFKKEDAVVQNRERRRQWFQDNNVRMTREIT